LVTVAANAGGDSASASSGGIATRSLSGPSISAVPRRGYRSEYPHSFIRTWKFDFADLPPKIALFLWLADLRKRPRTAETVMPVAAQSDEPGSRLRPFLVARPPWRGQWIAEAHQRRTVLVIAVKVSSGRMRETQFSSCNISVTYRGYGRAPPLRVASR
jgi:hypothetical protein